MVSIGRVDELLTSQINCVDLTVEGLSQAAEQQLRPLATRFITQGTLSHLTVPDEKTGQDAVRIIASSGATLKAYAPQRESLEEYFIRYSGGVAKG
jgi:hypothetical protein